ncbi:MAG: DUF2059 domain-containing protein [Brevundimonas sp.]|uniref:DUF2059 domain-containing protein n=1 Tax=Brevundimonas sp. TaxID=1871086 RepID=UPI00391CAD27
MKRLIIIAVTALTMAWATPGAAQDAGSEPLARRFVEISLTGMDKVLQNAVNGVIGELPEDMEAEHRRWFTVNAQPILMRHMRPLIDWMAADYAERFTRDELEALIAFYDTPQGRRIAFKQMESGAAAGVQTAEFQTAYVTELLTKFCAEFDCEDEGSSTAPANKPARR